ncbi:MAG: hypothetical protein H6713_04065 [Myxococcales bacterium]|nr:hypothetical protein [Myxococcales bacterium]MCB9749166.1 hypothetical protein [Myxococcales bacterium]
MSPTPTRSSSPRRARHEARPPRARAHVTPRAARRLTARRRALSLTLAGTIAAGLLVALSPDDARADVVGIATDAKRQRAPGILRKGLFGEIGLRPQAHLLAPSYTLPGMRFGVAIGGALTPRLKLGTYGNIAGYFGRGAKQLGGGVDVVATGYAWRGLYLRGGVGVYAGTPSAEGTRLRAAFGGLAGLGYEFNITREERSKKPNTRLGLGVDYDLRFIAVDQPRHAVVFGLHFAFN